MSKRSRSWISDWNPEDEKFWESKGKFIARRNLIWSIFAEHLGFSIWLLWSIVATKLPQAGFPYTTDQLFQLVALPGLIGSLIRFPYAFAVTTFGGRNWTIFSAAVLFIPTFALAYFDRVRVVAAWCELRNGFRHFRTDRIDALEVVDERYPRRRAVLQKEWRAAEGVPPQ